MGKGGEYECPDCSTSFGFGEEKCPGCSVEMDWDETEAVVIEDETIRLVDPRLPVVRDEVVPPDPVFSRWGLMFTLLTAMAFLGTLLLIRWDTWVRGAPEDTIGEDQRLLIYAGAVATTAFALLSILDILRGQTKVAAVPGGEG